MAEAAAPRLPGLGPARLAQKVAGLPARRAALLAFGLGLLAALALPPFYALPLLLPAFTGLVWLLDAAQNWRRAFVAGWCLTFGYFVAGLFWIGSAVLVVAEQFWWFMPIPVLGLPALLAIFFGLAAVLARRFFWRGPARIFSLATAWLLMEWVRSWIFTGFPWNQPGTVWAFSDAVLQFAALGGIWGLTLLTVVAAAAPATLADTGSWRARWLLPLASAAVLALVGFAGHQRLAAAPGPGEDLQPGLKLRLVQPAVEQSLKWRQDLIFKHLEDLMFLSRGPGAEEITHVVWPEMAFTFPLGTDHRAMSALTSVVPEDGLVITGLPRVVQQPNGERQVWNSLAAVSGDGRAQGYYDKEHLVPFGEYVPDIVNQLLGMAKLTHGRLDFSRGPGRITLDLPGLPPVSPVICYEVIFPGAVTGDRNAAWLLNVTNDAWFGTTSGPYQHFASARLRAIEQGLPLLRVANSGISAAVDGYGRVLQLLPLGERGVIDTGLPRPVAPATPFARLGNWVLVVLLGLSAALTIVIGRRS